MDSDEDDYLSEKFLQQLKDTSKPAKSYSERRKEAQRQSEARNLAGRMKSRKQIEQEAMEALKEGMNTSLFERESLAEGGGQSKAMKLMSKMGFKPGQSLGRREEETDNSESSKLQSSSKRTVPISINMWEGRKGLGAMKRPLSPESTKNELERAAKSARLNEEGVKDTFRSRARGEYEERRDEGRLSSAQKTCAALDENAGITFNILTLNARMPCLIPPLLREHLDIDLHDDIDDTYTSASRKRLRHDNLEKLSNEDDGANSLMAARLRREMQRDALVSSDRSYDLADDNGQLAMKPLASLTGSHQVIENAFTAEQITEANDFLHLAAQERLQRVLEYLREKHHFCFWCGVEYKDEEDMAASCPGETEELHD